MLQKYRLILIVISEYYHYTKDVSLDPFAISPISIIEQYRSYQNIYIEITKGALMGIRLLTFKDRWKVKYIITVVVQIPFWNRNIPQIILRNAASSQYRPECRGNAFIIVDGLLRFERYAEIKYLLNMAELEYEAFSFSIFRILTFPSFAINNYGLFFLAFYI